MARRPSGSETVMRENPVTLDGPRDEVVADGDLVSAALRRASEPGGLIAAGDERQATLTGPEV